MGIEEKLTLGQLKPGDLVKINDLPGTSLYIGIVDSGSSCMLMHGYYFLDLLEQKDLEAGWVAGGRSITEAEADLKTPKYKKAEWTKIFLDQAIERVQTEIARYPAKIYPKTNIAYGQVLEKLRQVQLS